MANFLKSFFTGKTEDPKEEKDKNNQKNFELFKFDGLRAQRIGQAEYAVKCFNEALAIQEDFETLSYLATTQIQLGKLDDARKTLERMLELEPELVSTHISLAKVCFMLEAYEEMSDYSQKAIAIDESDSAAYLLLAKAQRGLKDELSAVAHLTKAIVLKEDFVEAYLMRAEVLHDMQQHPDAIKDVELVLQQTPDEESALLLRGKIKESMGATEEARQNYIEVTEINPFNEQAYLCLGQLLISEEKLDEAIESLDEAIELNPDFAPAYHERGRAKLLKGDKEGSVEDMKKSMELDPNAKNKMNGEFNNFRDLYANVPL